MIHKNICTIPVGNYIGMSHVDAYEFIGLEGFPDEMLMMVFSDYYLELSLDEDIYVIKTDDRYELPFSGFTLDKEIENSHLEICGLIVSAYNSKFPFYILEVDMSYVDVAFIIEAERLKIYTRPKKH